MCIRDMSYSRFDLQLYDKAAENFAYLTVNHKRKLVIYYICIAVYEYRIPAAKISYKPCRDVYKRQVLEIEYLIPAKPL